MKLAFLMLSTAALVWASDCLYLVDADFRQVSGDAWMSSVDIYFISTDHLIVAGDASLANLRSASVLDADFASPGRYAIVHLAPRGGRESASALGDVLYIDGSIALVRTSGEVFDGIPADGVAFVQPLREMHPGSVPAPIQPRGDGYDDLVGDIVSAVDQTGYQGFITQLQGYLTRYSSTDNYDTAAAWVNTTLQGYGLDSELQYFDMGSYNCENVVAEKPGLVDSTKIFIICAHLDSTSPQQYSNAPGGDDNASGSAGVIEAARIMSGYNFKYTIRFICFGGEEQGLYGSSSYADAAAAAGDDIIGVMNLDMVLYGPAGQDVFWVPYDAQSTGLALALDAICDTYVPALEVLTEYDPGVTYSDHSSFWNAGYAAVLGIEQEVFSNPYYHQTTDLLSNYITYFPFGTNCIRGAIATVAYLAEPLGATGIEDGGTAGGGSSLGLAIAGANPASSMLSLQVSSTSPGMAALHVFDLAGRIVRSLPVVLDGGISTAEVSLSGLPDGVFVARISSGSSSASVRFVKAE